MRAPVHNLSLQGITGIVIGLIYLVCIFLIQTLIIQYQSGLAVALLPISLFEWVIMLIWLFFIVLAYISTTIINKKRRKKIDLKGWEIRSKKIRTVFTVQALISIVVSYYFMEAGMLKIIIPTILMFYGVTCITVQKLTTGPSGILGLFFVAQSIFALLVPNVQFLLAYTSFGIFHIIYGLLFFSKKNYTPST